MGNQYSTVAFAPRAKLLVQGDDGGERVVWFDFSSYAETCAFWSRLELMCAHAANESVEVWYASSETQTRARVPTA